MRVILLAVAVALILAYALRGCTDTSFTPKPHCAAGQTAQRMPSYQGRMWTCSPGGPAS